jgi:hypothetical protein
MNETGKSIMTIRFINGSEQKFEFPRQEDTHSIAAQIKDALSSNQILLELEDRLLIIPFQSIQSIEVTPTPPKLPATAIRNVRILE